MMVPAGRRPVRPEKRAADSSGADEARCADPAGATAGDACDLRAIPRVEHLSKSRVGRCAMSASRRLYIVGKALVGRKAESEPSALLMAIGTGLVILTFGAVWFVFLRGLTAVGRMLMLWHF
jgi:hypothetical protein